MNAPRLLTFVVFLVALPLCARCQSALSASPAISPSPSPAAQPLHYRPLTWEERNELTEAGERARRDPIVKNAEIQLREAAQEFDNALVSRDQAAKAILEKLQNADAPGACPHTPLTADEREELQIDREAMQHSPEAERLAAATANYQRAKIQALSEANPALASIAARLPAGGRGLGFRRVIAPGPFSSGTLH